MTKTSNLNKRYLCNNILRCVGERSQTSTGGMLGTTVMDCVQEAIYYVCTGFNWSELRTLINASSWSLDAATLPSTVYRVSSVLWYTSPDGTSESSYDYPYRKVRYVDFEEYKQRTLLNFTSNANIPQVWTIESKNKILVNPYPTNTLGKSKVYFEVYSLVSIPVADTSNFNCSDTFLNLVQYKATELFSLKHLNDVNTSGVFSAYYRN